jgi:cyclopropane fatty-acyl-phospholipid synthase-like methyltransferase
MTQYDIPFVPSSEDRLQTMLDLAGVTPGIKTIDLGCGDGRIVLAMAKLGAEAHGVEIDPGRFEKTREEIEKAGLRDHAFVTHASIWETDLNEYDIVTIYGITGMMERLEQKLKKESHPKTRFISNGFRLPNAEPVETRNSVYLYIM